MFQERSWIYEIFTKIYNRYYESKQAAKVILITTF